MRLSQAERFELVDRAVERFEPGEDPEYLAAWEAEIHARIAEIVSGHAPGIPWEGVRKGMFGHNPMPDTTTGR